MAKTNKLLMVCAPNNCDNQQTEPIKVGNKKLIFCCQKGFEKSLKDFNNYLKNTFKNGK